jgi:hypothetical protein
MVNPICLAVLRLMTNSNFVGCSTGEFGGFGAFKNLVHHRRESNLNCPFPRPQTSEAA